MRVRHLVVGGASAAAVLWSARRARAGAVSPAEEHVFRRFNELPDALAPLVWPVMQMGSLASVVAATAVTNRRGTSDDAVRVAVVGTAVWAGIKVVKPFVGRGRPAAHLDRVHVRGHAQTGLGYPSGHAAVSLTLALIAHRTPAERGWALAGAAATAAARMYVGAHLPLDILGGAAIGLLAGTAARELSTSGTDPDVLNPRPGRVV